MKRRRIQLYLAAVLTMLSVLTAMPVGLQVATAQTASQQDYYPVSESVVQPLNPGSGTFFQLSYPISTKTTYWNSANVIYSSHLDHYPPFYGGDNNGVFDAYTGESVTALYPNCGTRNNRQYCYGGHSGYDVPTQTGVAVYASHTGTVIASGWESTGSTCGGYGIQVLLRDETNPQFVTRYAHLNSTSVALNTNVARGQLLGYSGNTGCSSGPHLHWGLYLDTTWNSVPRDQTGQVLDPYGWVSQKQNRLGVTIQDNKFAGGHPSSGAVNEPINWNEGTVTGNLYLNKNRGRGAASRIGSAGSGVDAIEQWWANNYGGAGAPSGNPYYDGSRGGTCQHFEGGTYCPNGYSTFFTDVPVTHWAHRYIGWSAREGIIGGYADGTFRPSEFVTRQQFSKMMVNGFSLAINTAGGPHFSDVPPSNHFYQWIETLYNAGAISGYSDNPANGYYPCSSAGVASPCFLPGNNVSRGQTSKVVTQLAIFRNWISGHNTKGGPDYYDVPAGSPFYDYVQTLYNKGIVQYRREQDGAGNGGHYFVGWSATRAQIAMFLHETIYAVSPP